MKLHKSLTPERIMDAVERQEMSLDNPGFCIACGEESFDSDPDTRRAECEACGAMAVYGASELLFHIPA